jgi:hypothetical protein
MLARLDEVKKPDVSLIGPYLQIEDGIRFALDHMTSNADL